MKGSQTLLLLLATIVYSINCIQGTANTVADCCLQTNNKRIPASVVTGYEVQTPEKGCLQIAVVFFTNTRPSRKLCAPLGSPWVVKLMKKVDKKKDTEKNRADRKAKKTLQPQPRE